jgi:hypothetical protein
VKPSAPLIKIDGNFDDWQNIAPVVSGSPDAADNRSISKVYLAADAENFYVRIDIADKTQVSGFHPHNFDESQGSQFYAVSLDNGDSRDNVTVRLVHADSGTAGGSSWHVELGASRDATFRHAYGHWALNLPTLGPFEMKGSSMEAAIPLAKMKSLLSDLGSTKKYRVVGWTARGWDSFSDVRQTEAGSFSF